MLSKVSATSVQSEIMSSPSASLSLARRRARERRYSRHAFGSRQAAAENGVLGLTASGSREHAAGAHSLIFWSYCFASKAVPSPAML